MTLLDIFLLIVGAGVIFGAGFAFGKLREEFKRDRQEHEDFLARMKARKEEAEALYPNSPASPLVPAEVAYLPDEARHSMPTVPWQFPGMDDLPSPDESRQRGELMVMDDKTAQAVRQMSETIVSGAPWTPYPDRRQRRVPSTSPLARFEPDQQVPRWHDLVGPEVKPSLTTTDLLYLDDLFGDNSTPVQVKGKRRKIDMDV